MFENLKKIFFREKKPVIDVKNIELGTHVRIHFKDPRYIGLINADMTMRYDPDDIQKKYITGTLTSRKNVRDIIFIEVGAFKYSNGQRRERIYTLMNDEIEKIEVI